MANAAVMGPPPSPKEPRRSGRRSVPSASTSKSPAGSPTADSAPKTKENVQRPPLPPSNSSNKNKRGKQEEHDDTIEERKNAVNGNGNSNGNARAKRKGREKDKLLTALDNLDGAIGEEEQGTAGTGEGGLEPEGDDEEAGITRCICEGDEDGQGGFMAQCEMCEAWQHGKCMGFGEEADLPEHYYCELCRPDLYVDLLRKHAKRVRQTSTHSLHTLAGHGSRTSRSRSPVLYPKPTKRRNTMNSRDAAYEESFQALLEATAAEAAAKEKEALAIVVAPNGADTEVNGRNEFEDTDVISASRRKRKRSDEDVAATKRTRSASISSDRTAVPSAKLAREPTPVTSNSKTTPVPVSTSKANPRNKRGGGRKSQAQDLVSVDGEEAPVVTSRSRQANSRSKATTGNEQGGRRAQAVNGVGAGTSSSSHANSAAASRAYHQSHAYAVSQQPLFTSWNLPDYLAHLEPMLPTETPQPLEVRGSGIDSTGRVSLERNTERGVKVKWPAKRMSVGDMNKRVRALVEWVGREQASALERGRRREAVEKVLRDARHPISHDPPRGDENSCSLGENESMGSDGSIVEHALQEKGPVFGDASLASQIPTPFDSTSTMKMMEELMEELINFQERFGLGAKLKERERRNYSS